MSAVCDTPVKGKMLRATKLDQCGSPVLGSGAWPVHVVTKGFVTVEYAPEFDDGDEIEQKNANGDACVYEPGRRRTKYINVTVTCCNVDPELYTLFTGMPVVVDEHGNATGMRFTSRMNLTGGVGLELWSGTAAKKCAGGSNPRPRFGYFLLPQVIDGQVGDFTIENGTANFTLTGKAVEGEGWGVGPFDVYLRSTGVAKLTSPIGNADLMHIDWTTLPPPAASCGVAVRPADGAFAKDATDPTGMTAKFTASFVPADPNDEYTIDWGDGRVSPGPASAGTVSHTYEDAGIFLVTIISTATGGQRFASVAAPLA